MRCNDASAKTSQRRLLEERIPEVLLVVVPEADSCFVLFPLVPIPELCDVFLGFSCFAAVSRLDHLAVAAGDERAIAVVVAHTGFSDETTSECTSAAVSAREVVICAARTHGCLAQRLLVVTSQ